MFDLLMRSLCFFLFLKFNAVLFYFQYPLSLSFSPLSFSLIFLVLILLPLSLALHTFRWAAEAAKVKETRNAIA